MDNAGKLASSIAAAIPPEVLPNILRSLPVKSLLRYRCVSKSWRSLIDSDYFIKLHLHHSTQVSSNRTAIFTSQYDNVLPWGFYSFEIDSPNHPIELYYLSRRVSRKFKRQQIVGSCNGLVCFIDDRLLVIWNPSTVKFWEVELCIDLGLIMCYIKGFGYDSVNDDYKFVYIGWTDDDVCQIMVYSLKNDSWHTSKDSQRYDFHGSKGVYVCNSLHWLSREGKPYRSIVKFDLVTEKFSEMPLPDYGESCITSLTLSTLGGWLCLTNNMHSFHVYIWVMKEYGVESWSKLHVEKSKCLLVPIAYLKSSRQLLLICPHCNEYIWYDVKHKALQTAKSYLSHMKKMEYFRCHKELELYSETLVPLRERCIQ